MEQSQYIMAKIELPILLHSDGNYDVMNDRANVSFSKIYELPEIQAKTQIYIQDLFAQLGEGVGKIRINENTPAFNEGLVFRTTPLLPNQADIIVSEDKHITSEKTDGNDSSENHLLSYTDFVSIRKDIKPRHRKSQTGGKTFKKRIGNTQQYSRRVYPIMEE